MNFGDVSIECSYIQNLLYNKFVPTIRVLQDPKEALTGELYILKNEILQHKDSKDIFKNTYTLGKRYPGITRNYISTSGAYTSDLHEALGNYLRMLRDCKNVDLMPLYNCFSNRFEDDFSLPISLSDNLSLSLRSSLSTAPLDKTTRLVAIPVKFQHQYRIFCKKATIAKLQLALYDKKDLITYNDSAIAAHVNPYSALYRARYKQYLSQSYHAVNLGPYNAYQLITGDLFEDIDPDNFKSFCKSLESCLFLFVELPIDAADYLVVFEERIVSQQPYIHGVVSQSSLIKNASLPATPYSDKLVGYLLNYFISPLNDIPENIERIQKALDGQSIKGV